MDELFQKYRETGDVTIRNKIAEKYLYIAAVIAKKFVGRGVEYDDLYQVASLALIRGIERFDPEKGIKFSTYITPSIAGEIKNYFRDRARLVHLPRTVTELRARIRRATEELTAETGKNPSAAELAARLRVSEEEVVRAMEAGVTVSLDRPAEDGTSNYYDTIPAPDDGSIERMESADMLSVAVRGLNRRERTFLRLRYGEALSQAETAKRMGVSQMSVSRLERKVLAQIRENVRKDMS